MTIKQLPNVVTAFRIVGTIWMAFTKPLSKWFYVAYTLCGISDILDGMLARKFKATSEFGAKLDSIADLLFYTVMAVKILPILMKVLPVATWYMLAAVIVLRIMSYTLAAIKYKRFASLHTYMNKVTGLATFAIPYFIIFPFFAIYSYIGCSIAGVATIEELLMHIRAKEYQPGVKTIFVQKVNYSI
ncbi:MAG: CDP-alcohol phosphatidyltransferase family protein [Lachnospiraceae bacterium]|nr:CDP-alcohol phosphatidyltransferase family protein [Lachnospiraceae bacterium]